MYQYISSPKDYERLVKYIPPRNQRAKIHKLTIHKLVLKPTTLQVNIYIFVCIFIT